MEVGFCIVVVAVTLEGVDVVAGDGKALVVPGLEAIVVGVQRGTRARSGCAANLLGAGGDVAAADNFRLCAAAVQVKAVENIRSLVDSEVVAACGALTLDIEVVGMVD